MADEARSIVVGIDLGTTNSLVAYMEGDGPVVIPGEDGERLVPSVVAWTDHGVAVGNAARATLMSDSASAVYSAKRLMGRDLEDVEAELKLFPFRAGGRGEGWRGVAIERGRTDDDAAGDLRLRAAAVEAATRSGSSGRR